MEHTANLARSPVVGHCALKRFRHFPDKLELLGDRAGMIRSSRQGSTISYLPNMVKVPCEHSETLRFSAMGDDVKKFEKQIDLFELSAHIEKKLYAIRINFTPELLKRNSRMIY
jgi:hypothetical protein